MTTMSFNQENLSSKGLNQKNLSQDVWQKGRQSMKGMISVNVDLEQPLDNDLVAMCSKKGFSKDALIKNLIVNYLNKEESAPLINRLHQTNFSSLMGIIDDDNTDDLCD